MDPVIAAVVAALSAGALAMVKGVATDAAKDAYKALKAFVVKRVGSAEPFVEVVHQEPSQEAAGLLAKKITSLAGDSEADQLATTLRTAIEQMAKQPGADAVISLMNSVMGDFTAEGSTLKGQFLKASGSTLGNVTLKDVNVDSSTGTDDKKKA